jgi:hypothetical protein
LRWINAGIAKSVQTLKMILFSRPQPRPVAPPEAQPDTVRATTAMIERHDLLPVPAAWPIGVSQLAQAIDACQRDATALTRAQPARQRG